MTPSAISGISCSKSRWTSCGAGAAEDDLHAAAGLAYFANRGPHAFVRMVRFAGDLLAARQNGFAVGQRDRGGAVFVALHDAGDELPDFTVVLVIERVAFGFADLLDDDLLSGLSADAADRFFLVEQFAVVRGRDGAVLPIDRDGDLFVLAVVLLGGGDQRGLNRLENDLFVDVLFAMDRVDDSQKFLSIHHPLTYARNGLLKTELSNCDTCAVVLFGGKAPGLRRRIFNSCPAAWLRERLTPAARFTSTRTEPFRPAFPEGAGNSRRKGTRGESNCAINAACRTRRRWKIPLPTEAANSTTPERTLCAELVTHLCTL